MKTVLVFKTSITKKREVRFVKPFLNKLLTKTDYWNFDLEDCDNILRVETQNAKAISIASLFHHLGFYCEELQ
ncbi:hypothetical protein [Hanstruepera flava]|uniref:hypothetical protein n=1 Tax=Hanstruepera flava TaxID=2930218 RepID=UPI002028B218|nr:hypothetical protein [Hanstruepera flava]